ncbi:beta strand repeat-containing protein [Bacteroidota bacterium]
MKKFYISLLCIAISFTLFSQEIPLKISYQGKLLENNLPVNSTVNIVFTIGSWSEAHTGVQVSDGLYSVVLGETNPIPTSLFDNSSSATLEIIVSGTTLTPNTNIQSVPYAFKAQKAVNAEKIAGNPVSGTPNTNDFLKWNGTSWIPSIDYDNQTLSLTGNVLSISSGNSVTFPTDMDNQTLSISGNNLSITNGNTIALPGYNSGAGISISGNTITNTGDLSSVNEIQDLSITGLNLSISNGTGVTLPDDDQTLSIAGHLLSIDNGNSVTIPDDQTLNLTGNLLSIANGNSVTLPTGSTYTAGTGIDITSNTISNTGDLSATNEFQTLSYNSSTDVLTILPSGNSVALPGDDQLLTLLGNVLSIDDGNSVTLPTGTTYNAGTGIDITSNTISNTGDLSATNEFQDLSLTGLNLSISNGLGVTLPDDDQTLNIAGHLLSIDNGNSVTMPDDDNQTLSVSGNDLTIIGGNTVTLPTGTTYTAGTGINITSNTISNTGDLSVTNEFQDLSLSGLNLSISNGLGVTLPDDDQTLSIAGNQLSIINGNTVTLPDEQLLSLNGANLTISGGNTVTLPTGTTYTAGTGIDITSNTISNTGDLSSTNEIQDLSISGFNLSISGGGTGITLPSYTAGTGISISGTTITNTGAGPFQLCGSGPPPLYYAPTEYIGIGICPTYPLHVTGNISNGSVGYFKNTNTSGSGSVSPALTAAVWGQCNQADGIGYGGLFEGGHTGAVGTVLGNQSNLSYHGLHGYASGYANNQSIYGVTGNAWIVDSSYSNTAYGTYGSSEGENTSYSNYFGAYGQTRNMSNSGCYNYGTHGSTSEKYGNYNHNYGAYGSTREIHGTNNTSYGLYGFAIDSNGTNVKTYGAYANAIDSNGSTVQLYGLYAECSYVGSSGISSYGIYAKNIKTGTNDYALYAEGDFAATGTKSFVIDHPLDPSEKYLKHYCIESPEVLNVYRGTVSLNAQGEAVVSLPEYFDAINTNFSYHLTPIGGPAQVYIMEEITNNHFRIGGGKSGMKVSWMVYAERNDLYLQKNPNAKVVEPEKSGTERGKYLMPELYGKSREQSIHNQ